MSDQEIVGFVEDFSEEPGDEVPPLPFRVDDEVYYVAGQAPIGALLDLSALAAFDQSSVQDPMKMAKATTTLMAFLDSVMMPESAVRFAARMRTPIRPISPKQIMRIITWCVGVYTGKDRMAPSSSSPDGSVSTGRSSTDGAAHMASTPPSFT
jgi:hypothetical protein